MCIDGVFRVNRPPLPLLYPLVLLLGCFAFLTLIFQLQNPQQETDKLHEIRSWVQKEAQLEQELIAVRQIYSESDRGLKVSAYLVAPCSSLCGETSECAQICQEKMISHEGPLFRSLILIEAHNTKKNRFLGRVLIDSTGPIKLVSWLKKENKLAFIQNSGRACCNKLLIFSSIQIPSSKEARLKKEAQLNLGPFGNEKYVVFEEYSQSDHLVFRAPEMHFALLTPTPFYIPMVYHLVDGVIQPRPDLIALNIPTRNQYRAWLLEEGKRSTPLSELMQYLITFCLKGECQTADELMHLAYPQNEEILDYWAQLKEYALNSISQTSP